MFYPLLKEYRISKSEKEETVKSGYRGKVGQCKIILYNQVLSIKRVRGLNKSDVNPIEPSVYLEHFEKLIFLKKKIVFFILL